MNQEENVDEQTTKIEADITYCNVSAPYDEKYLNSQVETLERRAAQTWIKMLQKTEKKDAYKLFDVAKLKLLPFFRSAEQEIIDHCHYDKYYQDIMNFIKENEKCDKDPLSYYNLGLAFLCIGDLFRGSSYLAAAAQMGFDTENEEKPYIFGVASLYLQNYEQAIKYFTKSIENFSPKEDSKEIDPDSFLILFYSLLFRGFAYKKTNYLVLAIADFTALQDKHTRYITKYDIALQIADVFAQETKTPTALSRILTLTHIGSHITMRQYFYAKIKYFQSYDVQHEYMLLRNIQQNDRDLFILNAYSCLQQRKYLYVMSILKESLESRKMDHAIWYLYGYTCVKTLLFQPAEMAFQNACVLNPTNVRYKTAFGVALELNNHREEASVFYTEASTDQLAIDEFGTRLVGMAGVTYDTTFAMINDLQLTDISDLVDPATDSQIIQLLTTTLEIPHKYLPFTDAEEPYSQIKGQLTLFPDIAN